MEEGTQKNISSQLSDYTSQKGTIQSIPRIRMNGLSLSPTTATYDNAMS